MGDSSGNNCPESDAEPKVPMLAENTPKKRGGRKKFNETRHPFLRGVRSRRGGKWVCETREPKKNTRIWLGTFPTPEMAARAHDVASIALRGTSACLNYADSVWRLPLPASADMRDIQRAAAEAAEMFRPHPQELPASSSSAVVPASTDEELFGMPIPDAPPQSDYGDMLHDYLHLPEETTPHVVANWVDEDVFSMPEILTEMYNGMMLPPPPPPPPRPQPADHDDEDDGDISLWNF